MAGAGLSGICAAKSLLNHCRDSGSELHIEILEDHPKVGDELSGDACSAPTLRILADLGFKIKQSWVRRQYSKIRVNFPVGATNPNYLDASVDGCILDKTEVARDCIEDLSSQNGVRLRASCAIHRVVRHNGSFKIRASGPHGDQFFSSDLLIGATGYNSSISRMPEVKGVQCLTRDTWLGSLDFGLQASVGGDFTDSFKDARIDIYFAPSRPNAEYFYVFPFSEDYGYVGYVSTFENRRTCKDQLLKSLKRYGVRIRKDNELTLKGKFIPGTGPLTKPFAQGFLAVGDEAGQVEPIFRGGIRIGCEAGRIAGKVLSSHLENLGRDSLAKYEEDLKGISAIDYIDELMIVKSVIIPRICSYQRVTRNDLTALQQAFAVIENSGW